MAVAEVVHGEPGEEIEVLLAVRVPKARSPAAHEGDGITRVHPDLGSVGRLDDLAVVHRPAIDRLAVRLRSCCQRTSVPMPSVVKISSSTAWRLRPSITCVL